MRVPQGRGYSWRQEINSVGIHLNHLRSTRVEPVDHLLQQIAPDLRDTRGSVEVGEVSLRESKVTVEAVEQNLERILQRLEMMQPGRIAFRPHSCFGFEPEIAQIREQMPKDLKLICCREAVELQHDRWIERRDVAMPDVARHTGEEDVGVTTFECARQSAVREWNGVAENIRAETAR